MTIWKELQQIEKIIEILKKDYKSGCYEYDNDLHHFSAITINHFKNKDREKNSRGVYLIREKKSSEILYIGKAGSIDNNGDFKKQTISGRLKNKKDGKSSNIWTKDLYNERKGTLIIEYILLPETKNPTPAFIEALLLQTFLNDYHRLPIKNKMF